MAINYDNVNDSASEPWNHDCQGDNRLLVVAVRTNDGTECPDVKYNGVSMTCPISGANGLETLSIYYLAAPATGTNAIDVTIGGLAFEQGWSASYTGVNQTNPINTFSSSSAPSGTSYFHNVEPTASSWIVGAVIAFAANVSASTSTFARATGPSDHGIYDSGQNYSGRLNWTGSADSAWLSMAMAIQSVDQGGFMPIVMRYLNHK